MKVKKRVKKMMTREKKTAAEMETTTEMEMTMKMETTVEIKTTAETKMKVESRWQRSKKRKTTMTSVRRSASSVSDLHLTR